MDPALIAAMTWLEITGLDGRRILLSTNQIVSLAPPKEGDPLWTDEARCVVSLTDRKFLATRESCDEVRSRMK